MAELSPDGLLGINNEDNVIKLFNFYTNEVIYSCSDLDGQGLPKAQKAIRLHPKLTTDQKFFALYWFGYYHGLAVNC